MSVSYFLFIFAIAMKDIFTYYYDGQPIPDKVAKRLIVDACGRVPHRYTPWIHLQHEIDAGNPRAISLSKHFTFVNDVSTFVNDAPF